MDRFWIDRIKDNRVRGLVSELADAIADCDDPEILYLLKSSLKFGLANAAALREDEIRGEQRKRALPSLRKPTRRLG